LLVIAACGTPPAQPDAGTGSGDAAADAAVSTRELVWFADWRTQTGASDPALSDGGKFNDQLCNSNVLSVVPAADLSFPTTNVLRVEYAQPSACQMRRARDLWRTVAVGETMFWRVYYRNAVPDGRTLGFPHPLHLGEGNPYTMWVNFFAPSAGSSSMTLQVDGSHVWPDRGWSYGFVTNQTYRLELRLQRVTTTTGKASVRVYDSSGLLVAAPSEWTNGETGPNLRSLADSDPTVMVSDASFRLLDIGNNDPGGLVAGADQVIYFGGLAVAIGTDPEMWIGAYPSLTEAP